MDKLVLLSPFLSICAPVQGRGDITPAQFVCFGAVSDTGDQRIREGAVILVSLELDSGSTSILHCDIDLILAETGD